MTRRFLILENELLLLENEFLLLEKGFLILENRHSSCDCMGLKTK